MGHVQRMLLGDAGAIRTPRTSRRSTSSASAGTTSSRSRARACNGLAATIELMEHMPPNERPDVLAIYPSWWGILPTLVLETRCSRASRSRGTSSAAATRTSSTAPTGTSSAPANDPRATPAGEAVRDEVDPPTSLSEKRARATRSPHRRSGFDRDEGARRPGGRDARPARRRAALRRRKGGALRPPEAHRASARRTWWSAPRPREGDHRPRARRRGGDRAACLCPSSEAWVERVVAVPADSASRTTIDVTLANDGPGDFVDYHVWVTQ